jgi:arsenite methyltransferase
MRTELAHERPFYWIKYIEVYKYIDAEDSMTESKIQSPEEIRAGVRQHYGKYAERAEGCASSSCCGGDSSADISMVRSLYEAEDATDLPQSVTNIAAGCGDPVTLASLEPGQTVLDLGSGGGIDCFLAAKRVGPSGRVIGVDMTPQMLDQARANKAKLGADNVEFRLGEIEHLPVPDDSVDVILSNCVINLSTDKPQVFRDAYRVLKPGGRLAVSDIVTDGELPREVQDSMAAWFGCVAGALPVEEYIGGLEQAGFVEIQLERVEFEQELVEETLEQQGVAIEESSPGNGRKAYAMVDGELKEIEVGEGSLPFSAKIKARKPA